MKIRDEYPILDALQKGDLLKCHVESGMISKFDKDGCLEIFVRAIEAIKKVEGYYYITNTFYDAHRKAIPKIKNIETEIATRKFGSHVIIHSDGFVINRNFVEDGRELTELFVFSKNTMYGYGYVQTLIGSDGLPMWRGDGYLWALDSDITPKDLFLQVWADFMALLYFTEMCEIETKLVQPDKKFRDKGGSKIYNNTKNNITFLDCRWFTELIRNTPFTVTGHLRWQPCGENRNKRKLIWIEPFEKQGYHRKATKELQTP